MNMNISYSLPKDSNYIFSWKFLIKQKKKPPQKVLCAIFLYLCSIRVLKISLFFGSDCLNKKFASRTLLMNG